MGCRFLHIAATGLAVTLLPCCSAPATKTQTLSYTLTASGPVEMRDLQRAAKVLARYRTLTPQELAAATAELNSIFDAMVTVERENMQRMERQTAKAQRRRPRLITPEEARQQLLQRLGRDLALPVLRNESRSTVVFGRVDERGVTVSGDAWTTDQKVTDLPQGSRISAPKGGEASLLSPPLP